jgi:DNA polymerase I-like protein with 3'-5' exonuclease and polymerase domains
MGVTEKEAAPIFDTYHKEVPFVCELGWAVKRKAENVGFIRTMLGRRRRFDLWEPKDWDMARAATPMSFLEARNRWGMKNHQTDAHDEKWYGTSGKIKRAYCYKALNSLLQGSAADIMKVSMVEIWESGVCDVLGAPLLTVHDELNWSVPDTPEGLEAHAEAVKIMNDPRGLNVPMKTDVGQGATWAEAH